MTQRLEFTKIICYSVTAVREGDRIVGEIQGNEQPCYTREQLEQYWQKCQDEIRQNNEAIAQQVAAANGQPVPEPESVKAGE